MEKGDAVWKFQEALKKSLKLKDKKEEKPEDKKKAKKKALMIIIQKGGK